MTATLYSSSAGALAPTTTQVNPWRLLAQVWTRPRRVFETIAAGPGWLWAIPMGGALAFFYGRVFAAAFVGAPVSAGALIGGLAGILLGWLLRALLLHLLAASLGGRSDFGALYRATTWASFPLILRDAVQVGYVAATGSLIAGPGLSGLVANGVSAPSVWSVVLGRIDLYTIWYLALLVMTLQITAALTRGKATLAVALYSLASLAAGLFSLLLTSALG